MNYLAEKLSKKHNRKGFNCGKVPLDNYIQNLVNQDIKRRLAACFAVVNERGEVNRYYTLSREAISMEGAQGNVKAKMPKGYRNLPVTLLGRLAVDKKGIGKGLGEALLIDGLKRSLELSETIASHAIV